MSTEFDLAVANTDDDRWRDAMQWAGAFVASFKSPETRRAYQRDLRCWFAFCALHGLHPFAAVRRTHIELYLRQLEQSDPPPANATLYGRVATLSSWFAWLEDEDVNVGNAAARVRPATPPRRPAAVVQPQRAHGPARRRRRRGRTSYALVCLLGLNGLRVSEACGAHVTAIGGSRYQPTLFVIGKRDKPAEVVLNPRPGRPSTPSSATARTGRCCSTSGPTA